MTREGEGSEHCDSRGPLSSIGKIQDSVLNYRHWILTSTLCSDKCKMVAGLSLFRWTERTTRQNLGILRSSWALLHATLSHLLHAEKTMQITLVITEPMAVALSKAVALWDRKSISGSNGTCWDAWWPTQKHFVKWSPGPQPPVTQGSPQSQHPATQRPIIQSLHHSRPSARSSWNAPAASGSFYIPIPLLAYNQRWVI